MMQSRAGRCEMVVTGVVARSVIEVIQSRFDAEASRATGDTLLTVTSVDQAAIRALMIMLWDSGHEVLRMSAAPAECPPSAPE